MKQWNRFHQERALKTAEASTSSWNIDCIFGAETTWDWDLMAGSKGWGMPWWQTRSEGKKWFRNTERSTEGSQVTGRKLGKTKIKNETAISEVCCTFMSDDLRDCTWSQEKRQAPGAWCSFCFSVTFMSNAVQEKHIHREDNSWCWRCSTCMTHVGRVGCMFCFNPSFSLVLGQNTCA